MRWCYAVEWAIFSKSVVIVILKNNGHLLVFSLDGKWGKPDCFLQFIAVINQIRWATVWSPILTNKTDRFDRIVEPDIVFPVSSQHTALSQKTTSLNSGSEGLTTKSSVIIKTTTGIHEAHVHQAMGAVLIYGYWEWRNSQIPMHQVDKSWWRWASRPPVVALSREWRWEPHWNVPSACKGIFLTSTPVKLLRVTSIWESLC